MKLLKTILIIGVMWLSLVISGPAWADAGKYIKMPEYAEVTQAIADLTNSETPSELTPEVIQQKLADLRFQKYILETATARSSCRNDTGKTLAIYAKSKKASLPTLYFLGAGQVTDDDVHCVGIYSPVVSNVTSETTDSEPASPVVTKFVPGTQLIATANPAGVIEFNVPASGSFKVGEIDWPMPTLTQAEVETQTPNAPVD